MADDHLHGYLALEVNTGAQDGLYRSERLCRDVCSSLEDKYPDTVWLAVGIDAQQLMKVKGSFPTDDMWHVNKLSHIAQRPLQ